jgi:CRP-like cAMP-binding protein
MAQKLMQRLFQGRFRVPQYVRETLQIPKPPPIYSTRQRLRRPPKYIKGVKGGNYFRIKIPPKQKRLPDVPKLPPTNPMPKPFKTPPPTLSNVLTATTESSYERYARRSLGWLKANAAIIILNVGSICTLVGFTRSDILQLRALSSAGNIMFVMYNLGQSTILWPSVAWSSLFAAVNGYKILEILHERTAEVHMTEEQEKYFVDHFMPHGITPKQFERLENKATKFCLKKGELLARKGDQLDHLYLVIEGSTHAHIFGRQLTAASTNADTKGDQKAGGDSGAWVGEMAFLDRFWEKEQGKYSRRSDDAEEESLDDKSGEHVPRRVVGAAIYTILADEDCTVMAWSHEDMEELMESSTDLRAALTRAMTSALVGKVVNLTVSRSQKGLPRWTTWMSEWKHNDGAKVQLRSIQKLPEDKAQETEPAKPVVA